MSSENTDSNLQMNIPQENQISPGKRSPKLITIAELFEKTPKSSKLSPDKAHEKYKDLDLPFLEDSRVANSKKSPNENNVEEQEKKDLMIISEIKEEENLDKKETKENQMEIVAEKEENFIDNKDTIKDNCEENNVNSNNENDGKANSKSNTPAKINSENTREENIAIAEKNNTAESDNDKDKIEEKSNAEVNNQTEVATQENLDVDSNKENQDLISSDNDKSKEENINVISSSIFEKKDPAESKDKNSSETERNSEINCSQEENKIDCNEVPLVGENGNFIFIY